MKPRRQLFFKYVTLILALVGGALAVSGAISVYFSYQETRKSLLELEQEKARAAADAHLQKATGGIKVPGIGG